MGGTTVVFNDLLNCLWLFDYGAGLGVFLDENSTKGGRPLQYFELALLEHLLDIVLSDEVESERFFGVVPRIGRTVCIENWLLIMK